jgi:hypothetical protein
MSELEGVKVMMTRRQARAALISSGAFAATQMLWERPNLALMSEIRNVPEKSK